MLNVDYLGPANAEQRTERKAEWRSWLRKVLGNLAKTTVLTLVGISLIVSGVIVGAYQHGAILEMLP